MSYSPLCLFMAVCFIIELANEPLCVCVPVRKACVRETYAVYYKDESSGFDCTSKRAAVVCPYVIYVLLSPANKHAQHCPGGHAVTSCHTRAVE